MIACKCGHLNADGSRFCAECGNPLTRQCPDCHAEIAPDSNFCQNCGKSLLGISSEIAPLPGGSVVAGDVHTTIIYNQEKQGTSPTSVQPTLHCLTCGKEIPTSSRAFMQCSVCGQHFCGDHMDLQARMCQSCLEKTLSAFEYYRYDNGKYSILGVKNKDTPSITLPNCVESIESDAFCGCAVLTVTLPNGLLKIGDRAFADCSELVTIRFPSSLKIIGSEAFRGCKKLNLFSVPYGVSVGKDAFAGTPMNQRQEKFRNTIDKAKSLPGNIMKHVDPDGELKQKSKDAMKKIGDNCQNATQNVKTQLDTQKQNAIQKSSFLARISAYKHNHLKGWYLSFMIVWIILTVIGFALPPILILTLPLAIYYGLKFSRLSKSAVNKKPPIPPQETQEALPEHESSDQSQ